MMRWRMLSGRVGLAMGLGAGVAGTALAQPAAAPQPPPTAAQTVANPNLTIASVKMEGGFFRTTKLIGMAVYNDQQQKIGAIDDLLVKEGNHIVMAVVSVGGFLGLGSKLVAIPYEQLHLDINDQDKAGKMTLSGATKDTLNAMPTFTYGG
jgi:sporulation protein YlmC with PRC-barrel domain